MAPYATAKPPLIVTIIWAILIFSLVGGLWWMSLWSSEREDRLSKPVFSTESALSSDVLADCLMDGIALGKDWRKSEGKPATIQSINAARHLKVEIEDLEARRRLSIFTRNGQALRQQDLQALRRCL